MSQPAPQDGERFRASAETCVYPDISTARTLLGSGKIIGITANTVDEALTACEQGADYLGIGTIFSTQT